MCVLGKLTNRKRATELFDLYFTHDFKLGPLNYIAMGNVTVSVLGSNVCTRENHIPQVYFCQFTSKCILILNTTRRVLILGKQCKTTWFDSKLFIFIDTLGCELTVFVKFEFASDVFPRYANVMPATICDVDTLFALKTKKQDGIEKEDNMGIRIESNRSSDLVITIQELTETLHRTISTPH